MAKIINQKHSEAGKAASFIEGSLSFDGGHPIAVYDGELCVTLQAEDRVFQVRFNADEMEALRLALTAEL